MPIGLLVTLVTGCAYHDGAFVYTASGRLVDDQQQPVADRPIFVSFGPLSPTTRPAEVRYRTSIDGQFSQKLMTGLAWGYTSLFGVIPLGSTNPKPPPLERIYIAVESPTGEWVEREIALDKSQQKERGTVSLGDFSMPR